VGTDLQRTLCGRIAAAAAAIVALSLARVQAQDMASQVFTLVNQQRAANGLAPLSRNSMLDSSAARESSDLANNGIFSHTGSDSSTPGQRMQAAGYYWYTCGENIAAGQTSAQAVMNTWMGSSGHRANILNPDFKDIGISVVYSAGSPYGYYWTQDFGARTGGGTTTSPPPTSSDTPQITGIDRTSGPSGTTVTITGQNLGTTQGSSRVYVRSTTAYVYGTAQVVSWSNTSVKLRIYPSTASGYTTGRYYLWLRVYSPAGTYKDTSAAIFTVPTQ
jgi:uncharacterized protein YkwD